MRQPTGFFGDTSPRAGLPIRPSPLAFVVPGAPTPAAAPRCAVTPSPERVTPTCHVGPFSQGGCHCVIASNGAGFRSSDDTYDTLSTKNVGNREEGKRGRAAGARQRGGIYRNRASQVSWCHCAGHQRLRPRRAL